MKTASFLAGCFIAFLAGYKAASLDIVIPFPDVIPDVVVTDEKPPVPGDGRHVLVIYETDDRISLPRDQRSILDSVPLREWLQTSKWDAEFLDPDTAFLDGDEWFKQALTVERTGLPWVVVSNGKAGFSGPLPESVEKFKELVGRYGG